MTIFQDKLLARTCLDEAGDYVVPNMLSPRDLVFRPDIGQELCHHHYLIQTTAKLIEISLSFFCKDMSVLNFEKKRKKKKTMMNMKEKKQKKRSLI